VKPLLSRILYSRIVGFLLIALLVFCAIMLAQTGWTRYSRPSPTELVDVPTPSIGDAEPIVRRHLDEARQRCDRINAAPAATPHQRAAAYGELGRVFLAYDFNELARAALVNATRLQADDFRWWYFLAHACLRGGQTEEAAPAMGRAVRLMETDVAARPEDRLAGLCFLAEVARRLNKPEEARQTLDLVLQMHPRCLYALVRLAQLASESGDGDKTLAYGRQALEIDPERTEVRSLLATEYRRRGETGKAEALPIDPASKRATRPLVWPDPLTAAVTNLNRSAARLARLSHRQLDEGRVVQAASLLQRALQAKPDDTTLRINYGGVLLRLERYEEALQHFEEARRRLPQSEEGRWGLCLAYAATPATHARALEEARAWRKEQPNNPKPLELLAEVHERLRQPAEALECYREIRRREPPSQLNCLSEARCLAALGRAAEARSHLEQALKTFPGDGDVRHNLARLLAANTDDKVRNGRQALETARALCANQRTVVRAETLALALAELGRFEEAVKQLQWAVTACGQDGDPKLRRRLARELANMRQQKPCRETWPFSGFETDRQ
jgi:tetratricopeptide (TPR) repeat protein